MTEASTDSGAAALRTYDAVCRALTSAAASAPLLVVLEDLQWADTSSLRLLAYAAEALEDTAVGLLITRRTPSELPSEPHSAALAALARHGVIRIPLGGLSGQAVTSLLSERVGEHDPSLAAVLSRRTGGNPFYLIEMARLLAARGTTDPAEAALLPVPDGVRDVIRLRLDRMPADALEVLQHAAALGGRVDPDSVAATTGRAVPEVLDQLDLCVASGLVVGEGGGYDFAHALTRESVYAEMPVGRRLRIHSALARTLGQRAETDPELIPEVAYHAQLAAALGPDFAALAVDPLVRSAVQAEQRHAFPEAALTWRSLQELARELPGLDAERRFTIDYGAGRAELRLGNAAPARASIGAATVTATQMDRWDLVATAATSFAAAGSWSWREFGSTDPVMIDTLRACLDHLAEGPVAAMVLACLQMEHYYARQSEVSEAFGRQSVEMARRTGDPAVLLRVLLVGALAAWGQLSTAQRVQLGEEIVQLPMDAEQQVLGWWNYGTALHQAGRPVASDAAMARCFAAADRLRHTGSDIPIAWWRFMRAVERASPDAAALGAKALDLHRRTGFPAMQELTGIHSVRVGGRGAPVAPEVQEAARASGNAGFRAIVAHALLEAGEDRAARDTLGAPPHPDERNYATRAAHCLRLAVLAAGGNRDEIAGAMGPVAAYSGELVAFGSVDALGAVDYFIALGSAALGDSEAARVRWWPP